MRSLGLNFLISFLIALIASILYWSIPELARKLPTLEPLSELLGLLLYIPSLPSAYILIQILNKTEIIPPDPVDFGIFVSTYAFNLFILLQIFNWAKNLLIKKKRHQAGG